MEARAAVVLRSFPFAFDPPSLFEAAKRGKQRSGLDVERVPRHLLNARGDSGSVHRFQFESPEDQQIEGPPRDVHRSWYRYTLDLMVFLSKCL